MKKSVAAGVLVSILLAGALFAQAPKAEKSLYERLGGQPAIEAFTKGLVDRILADNRVNKFFAHAASSPENTKMYLSHLTAFVCSSVGGPCKYTGPDMATVHKGRRITNEAFNAVAEDIAATLDQLKVPAKEKGEVMAFISSLKPSIVQTSQND